MKTWKSGLKTKTGRINGPQVPCNILKTERLMHCSNYANPLAMIHTHTSSFPSSGVCASKWADRFRMMADEWGQVAWGHWIAARYLQQTHVFQSNYTPAANGASDSPTHTHHIALSLTQCPHTPTNTHGHMQAANHLASKPWEVFCRK